MKGAATRWLLVLAKTRAQSALVALAGLAIVGAAAVGAAPVASGSAETPAVVGPGPAGKAGPAPGRAPAKAAAKTAKALPKTFPAKKQLKHDFMLQPNYYYCGPTATRIALSAHGKLYSLDRIAKWLGTTPNGTNSAVDITRVLNAKLGKGRYHTTMIPGQKATAREVAQLKTDVVTAINQGDPVVANVAGTVVDNNGQVHSYEGGHYLPVWGYLDNGNTVKIADEADTVGSPYYTMSTRDFANWIATRGYSS